MRQRGEPAPRAGVGRHREFAIRAALGAGRGAAGRRRCWPRASSWRRSEAWPASASRGPAPARSPGRCRQASVSRPSARLAPLRSIRRSWLSPFGLAAITGILFSLAPMLGVAPMRARSSEGGRGPRRHRAVHGSAQRARRDRSRPRAGRPRRRRPDDQERGPAAAVDPGLIRAACSSMDIALPQTDTYGPPDPHDLLRRRHASVAALPGVPCRRRDQPSAAQRRERRPRPHDRRPARAPAGGRPERVVSAHVSRAISRAGYPDPVRGRDFTPADSVDAAGAVIINETTAKRYWPNEDPVGVRLKLGRPGRRIRG